MVPGGHWRLSILPWSALTRLMASLEDREERGLVLVTEYWPREAEHRRIRPGNMPRVDITTLIEEN